MKKTLFILAALFTVFLTVHAQIPNEGLVAHYPFNGDANDESGNNLNGSTQGGVSLSEDRFGDNNSAYYFDGTDDYIQVADNDLLSFTNNQFTFSIWVKLDGQDDLNRVFLCKTNITSNFEYTYGYFPSIDSIYFHTNILGGNCGVYGDYDSVPIFSEWVHYVYTANGTTSYLYKNGQLISTSEKSECNLGNGSGSLYIGRGGGWNQIYYFKGWIDDIRFYDRPIDETEIQNLYHENGFATVTDVDGNTYNTVTIGDQTWMAENLKTTKYNNGDEIGTTTPVTLDISGEIEPKYQWAAYADENYVDAYGRYYTWYAITDSRGVCPSGWHVPSDAEWTTLTDYLTNNGYGFEGSGDDIAKSMAATSGWTAAPTAGSVGNDQASNNSSGFSALPACSRGDVSLFGNYTYWWSTTESIYTPTAAVNRLMAASSNNLNDKMHYSKYSGLSVRCLKDSEATPPLVLTVEDVTANQGQGLEVPVSVSELVTDDNIIAYQFDIDYDNTVLEYTGNDLTGTLAEGGTVEVNTSVAGKLNISYMTSTALTGAGNILLLQFNTLKADTTEVLISNAYLNATSVTDLTAGTVIIKDDTPPTAAISIDDTDIRCWDYFNLTAVFNEPMLESNAVKISLSGAVNVQDRNMTRINDTVYTVEVYTYMESGQVNISLSNGTDLWGNEVISTPTSGETFSIILINYGDVDDDGKILAYDAALTLQYSVGLDPLPTIDPLPWEKWRDTTANVDGVSGITANDAGMILQYSAGIITSFAASAKKSVSQGFISIEVINNEIILYSFGDLMGLNISAVNEDQILETPVIMADNLLSAFNISGTTYSVGICTANSPENGVAIMKIPYTKSGAVTLNMIINTDVDTRTLNLSYSELTGMEEYLNDKISIYPNPAKDVIRISGLDNTTMTNIYSADGKLMYSDRITDPDAEINVSGLSSGLYIMKFETNDQIVIKRFAVE